MNKEPEIWAIAKAYLIQEDLSDSFYAVISFNGNASAYFEKRHMKTMIVLYVFISS